MLGGVGTDAMRLYYIGREKPGSKAQAYLSIAVDRVAGIGRIMPDRCDSLRHQFRRISATRKCGASSSSAPQWQPGILLSALVVGLDRYVSQLFGGLRGIYRIATHMGLLVHHYRHSLPLVGLCLLLSVIRHALMLASLVVLTWALFGDALSISQLGLSGVMATFANQIPITPGVSLWGRGRSPICAT
jgi:hypothetical protein